MRLIPGASNDQTEDAQTWEHENMTAVAAEAAAAAVTGQQVLQPQLEIDIDALPVELVPPPPPSQSQTRCPGFWKCIVRLHRRFGQRIARQQIDRGLRLYG